MRVQIPANPLSMACPPLRPLRFALLNSSGDRFSYDFAPLPFRFPASFFAPVPHPQFFAPRETFSFSPVPCPNFPSGYFCQRLLFEQLPRMCSLLFPFLDFNPKFAPSRCPYRCLFFPPAFPLPKNAEPPCLSRFLYLQSLFPSYSVVFFSRAFLFILVFHPTLPIPPAVWQLEFVSWLSGNVSFLRPFSFSSRNLFSLTLQLLHLVLNRDVSF